MDRALYIAASGAITAMRRQDNAAHNLANVSTPGFRAQLDAERTAPVIGGEGSRTRAFVVGSTPGADFTSGELQQTGRELDLAIAGEGWFSVQAADGSEAYTRAGTFTTNDQGVLSDQSGRPVLGDSGPIQIPPDTRVQIARDGTISGISETNPASAVNIGRLKLVNPSTQDLVRGNDGLFRLKAGGQADAAPEVTIVSGAIEGSNVNPVDVMVKMISAARHFDTQIKLIQNADQNARSVDRIISPST